MNNILRLLTNHNRIQTRKYKARVTGAMTSNIEELLKENQVTPLQGVAVKALKGWAAEEKMKEATCCLLSLGRQ